MRIRVLILALSVLAVAAGCGDGKSVDSDAASTATTTTQPAGVDLSKATFVDDTKAAAVQVNAIDNSFDAQYVTVKVGTKVTFRNDGHNEHNLVPAVPGAFAGAKTDDFEPGVEHEVTFDQAGDYPYYCSLHGTTTKGMTGAIRVVK